MTDIFEDDVVINDNLTVNGDSDETQVTVKGHSTQNEALQSWQDNAGNTLAEVTGDGRVQVGDEPPMGTPDAMLEVHRDATSTAKPKRGIATNGEIQDATDDSIAWSASEVMLSGDNTDVNRASGLRVGASKVGNGTLDEAVGLEVNDITGGTDNYAIRTGQGAVRVGETLELDEQTTAPAKKAGAVPIYAKSDGKLYTKDAAGNEQELGSGGSGGSSATVTTEEVVISKEIFNQVLTVDSAVFSDIVIPSGYDDIELICHLVKDTTANANISITFNDDTNTANYRYSQVGSTSTNIFDATAVYDNKGYIGTPPFSFDGVITIVGYEDVDHYKSAAFGIGYADLGPKHGYNSRLTWASNAAINKISIASRGNNFAAGSYIRVIAKKKMDIVTDVSGVSGVETPVTATTEELVTEHEIYDEVLASDGAIFPPINLPVGYDDVEIIYNLHAATGGGEVRFTVNSDTNELNYVRVQGGRDGTSTTVDASAQNTRIFYIPITASNVPAQGKTIITGYGLAQKHWADFRLDWYDADTMLFQYRILHKVATPITTIDINADGVNTTLKAGSYIRVIARKKTTIVTGVNGSVVDTGSPTLSDAANLVYATPDNQSGPASLRKLKAADISDSSSPYGLIGLDGNGDGRVQRQMSLLLDQTVSGLVGQDRFSIDVTDFQNDFNNYRVILNRVAASTISHGGVFFNNVFTGALYNLVMHYNQYQVSSGAITGSRAVDTYGVALFAALTKSSSPNYFHAASAIIDIMDCKPRAGQRNMPVGMSRTHGWSAANQSLFLDSAGYYARSIDETIDLITFKLISGVTFQDNVEIQLYGY